MASGSTQVCLTAMFFARLRAERALRRFEKRLEGVAGPDAGSWCRQRVVFVNYPGENIPLESH